MWVAAVMLASCLAGCFPPPPAAFYGSAPASEGKLYVAGARNEQKAIYLCPDLPGKGKCEPVELRLAANSPNSAFTSIRQVGEKTYYMTGISFITGKKGGIIGINSGELYKCEAKGKWMTCSLIDTQ